MQKLQTDNARMSQMTPGELFKGKRKDAEGEEKGKLSEGKNISKRCSETAVKEAE